MGVVILLYGIVKAVYKAFVLYKLLKLNVGDGDSVVFTELRLDYKAVKPHFFA